MHHRLERGAGGLGLEPLFQDACGVGGTSRDTAYMLLLTRLGSTLEGSGWDEDTARAFLQKKVSDCEDSPALRHAASEPSDWTGASLQKAVAQAIVCGAYP